MRGNPAPARRNAGTACRGANAGQHGADAARCRDGFRLFVPAKRRGAQGLGVQRVAFPAGRGIDGQAACGSRRVQQRLYRFRAGVEGLILVAQAGAAVGAQPVEGRAGLPGLRLWRGVCSQPAGHGRGALKPPTRITREGTGQNRPGWGRPACPSPPSALRSPLPCAFLLQSACISASTRYGQLRAMLAEGGLWIRTSLCGIVKTTCK